ncbi:MAG: LacI family transcriptional regulator [Chloroflexota bacterium]|nr:LacI family transcriptional regulator [Caldilinea sp.]GIK72956.1 MAG: LacI family transcriptional regulator [Chloroflexota bacterium]
MTNSRSESVTIVQVAQEAGVSAQTVSRVLNNRPDVSAATRERILGVIERLNYKPNAIARGLVQRKTHSLGVIAAGLEKYGPLRTVIGIEQETRALGYSLLLSLIPDDATENQVVEALEHLLARQVDGVLWSAPEIGPNRAWLDSLLGRLTVPTVFMSMHPHPAVTVIDTDNRMGGNLATVHLTEQGCRRVAHICGPQSQWSALQRRLGWEDALRAVGQTPDAALLVEGDWTAASGYAAIRELIERVPDLDGVFAGNDQMGLGALLAASELGIRIPEQLAIIGYDNIPEAAYMQPPLSSIRQHLHDSGAIAVRELIRQITLQRAGNNSGEGQTILVEPDLIVRRSSLYAKP